MCDNKKNGENHQTLNYLYLSQDSSAVHSAGYVHRVPPDVILWFLGSDDSGYYWTVVDT